MTAIPLAWRDIQRLTRRKGASPDPYSLGGYTQSVDASGAAAGARGEQAQNAYVNRAENFDASRSLNEWARGAYGNISTALTQRLRDLTGQAVGAGRLKTGYFDEDQGQVVRGAQQDFSNVLAGQSLNALQLQSSNDRELGAYGERQTEFATDVAQSRREEMLNAQREQAARARQRKRGIGQLIGGVLGAAGGFAVGGPGGAAAGWGVGRTVGGSF